MSIDPRWEEVREDGLPDNGLREIIFPDAYAEAGGVENAEWQKLVDWIRSCSDWTVSYAEGGDAVEMPGDVAEIMERSPTVSTLWRIDIGRGVIVNTYFAPGEIEFDVDPREVRGQTEFALVCDFVRSIGALARRRVEVSAEGSNGPVIMSFDPATGEFTQSTP